MGRPATGQGKTIYVPDRFLNIVEMLKSEDWEGAVKEILDLCSGISIQPYDLEQLSKTIQIIDKSSIDRNEISDLASQNFSILNTVDKYKTLYKSIIPLN